MTTSTPPRAAVPAQPDALQIESAYEGEELIGYRITGSGNPDSRALVWIDQKAMPGIRDGNEFVPGYGKRIDYRPLSLHAQVAALTAAQPDDGYYWGGGPPTRHAHTLCTSQGAAERAVPADPMDWKLPCDVVVGHGAIGKGCSLRTLVTRMKVLYEMATGSNADEVANRTPEQRTALADAFRARIAAHVQAPAQTEHVAADVSKNGLESNMTGGAIYVCARSCENCGHSGINDGHATDDACNTCGWSGASPKEDHCPGCGRDGTMTEACPECSGVYALVADTTIDIIDRASHAQAPAGAAGDPLEVFKLDQGFFSDSQVENLYEVAYGRTINSTDALRGAVRFAKLLIQAWTSSTDVDGVINERNMIAALNRACDMVGNPVMMRAEVLAAFEAALSEGIYRAPTAQAAPAAGAVAGPGWKLVPVEPTPEMCDAAIHESDRQEEACSYSGAAFWKAMLAAAPTSATQADSGVQEDAARYRLVRRGQHWSVIDGIGDTLRGDELDRRVDAALAANGGSNA